MGFRPRSKSAPPSFPLWFKHGQPPIWTLPNELLQALTLFGDSKSALNFSATCHPMRDITYPGLQARRQHVINEVAARIAPAPQLKGEELAALVRELEGVDSKTTLTVCMQRAFSYSLNAVLRESLVGAFLDRIDDLRARRQVQDAELHEVMHHLLDQQALLHPVHALTEHGAALPENAMSVLEDTNAHLDELIEALDPQGREPAIWPLRERKADIDHNWEAEAASLRQELRGGAVLSTRSALVRQATGLRTFADFDDFLSGRPSVTSRRDRVHEVVLRRRRGMMAAIDRFSDVQLAMTAEQAHSIGRTLVSSVASDGYEIGNRRELDVLMQQPLIKLSGMLDSLIGSTEEGERFVRRERERLDGLIADHCRDAIYLRSVLQMLEKGVKSGHVDSSRWMLRHCWGLLDDSPSFGPGLEGEAANFATRLARLASSETGLSGLPERERRAAAYAITSGLRNFLDAESITVAEHPALSLAIQKLTVQALPPSAGTELER